MSTPRDPIRDLGWGLVVVGLALALILPLRVAYRAHELRATISAPASGYPEGDLRRWDRASRELDQLDYQTPLLWAGGVLGFGVLLLAIRRP